MIRLQKGPEPAVITAEGRSRTEAYLAALKTGGKTAEEARGCYHDPEIKKALKAEARDKCIYCETKAEVTETEHIVPVSKQPHLILVWSNLGLSCEQCNRHKSASYSETLPLVNPFVEDPASYIQFHGQYVYAVCGEDRGTKTIERLHLNRDWLVTERQKAIEAVGLWLKLWSKESDPELSKFYARKIKELTDDSAEYTAAVRTFVFRQKQALTAARRVGSSAPATASDSASAT